jgi:HD superfamily phosphohydrolase YqeK
VIKITNKERFLEICSSIQREGADDLMKWLERSDFYAAPASTRYHGNYQGGLLEHSLNVYDELKRLSKVYSIDISDETAAIISLFHDLCKVNYYTVEKRNRKNDAGEWEKYDAYTIKEKFCFGGHGSKSVFIVQNFIKLTPEEAVAINCHMGLNGDSSVSNAYERYPVAWLLHVADEAATFIVESKKEAKSVF